MADWSKRPSKYAKEAAHVQSQMQTSYAAPEHQARQQEDYTITGQLKTKAPTTSAAPKRELKPYEKGHSYERDFSYLDEVLAGGIQNWSPQTQRDWQQFISQNPNPTDEQLQEFVNKQNANLGKGMKGMRKIINRPKEPEPQDQVPETKPQAQTATPAARPKMSETERLSRLADRLNNQRYWQGARGTTSFGQQIGPSVQAGGYTMTPIQTEDMRQQGVDRGLKEQTNMLERQNQAQRQAARYGLGAEQEQWAAIGEKKRMLEHVLGKDTMAWATEQQKQVMTHGTEQQKQIMAYGNPLQKDIMLQAMAIQKHLSAYMGVELPGIVTDQLYTIFNTPNLTPQQKVTAIQAYMPNGTVMSGPQSTLFDWFSDKTPWGKNPAAGTQNPINPRQY